MYIPELTSSKDARFDEVKYKWAAIHEVFELSREVIQTQRKAVEDRIKKELEDKVANLKWKYELQTISLPVDGHRSFLSMTQKKDEQPIPVEKANFYIIVKSTETDLPESTDHFGFKKVRKSKPFRIVNSVFLYADSGEGWLIPGLYNGKELIGAAYELLQGHIPDIFLFDKPTTLSY